MHILILIMYNVLSSPWALAFGNNWGVSLMILEIYTDFMFLLDMVAQFFISFTNENEVVVRDFEEISLNYFFGWFFLDLFASIPVSTITVINYLINGEPSGQTEIVGAINNAMKFFKVFRIFQSK